MVVAAPRSGDSLGLEGRCGERENPARPGSGGSAGDGRHLVSVNGHTTVNVPGLVSSPQ